jgi:hypothetical protein
VQLLQLTRRALALPATRSDLFGNLLTGTIPATLSQWTQLTYL